MQKSIRKSTTLSVISLTLIILSSLFLTVHAEDTGCIIDSVLINSERDRVTVSASLSDEFADAHKDETLYFFELLPSNDPSNINSLTPIAKDSVSKSVSKNIEFKKKMLYSSFVLALENEDGTYTAVSDRVYVQNPEILSTNSEPYPARATKKGLCTQITSDAQYLGAAHTIISIDMSEYMAPYQSGSTLPFTRYGQTFYFYEDMLSALDHKVKVLTESGMNVYFNIVLGNSGVGELNFMYLNSNSSTASLYAINTTTVPSSRYFMVFCEFMAERYSSPNHSNGFVPAYILGYEVNSTGIWNHAGEVGFDDYVNYYENAYRILYSAVKSTYENGRVFVSVSNLFNQAEGISDFGAKEFLTAFAANMRTHGDTEWALAVNPYASDPTSTEFWNDVNAADSLDTPYLTMKNLDVLSEFMRLDTMTYKNDVRDIIISEFGINGSFDDARNNDCQAAAYALAYAIADMNEDIDAFIYYRHVDHPAESAHLGLWTSNAVNPLTPENKKSIYNIFRNADTSNCTEGLDMARAFIGDELYNKYLEGYAPTAKRTVIESIPVLRSDIRATFKEKVLFDLNAGELCDFYPSDNSSYVELRPISEDDFTTALYSLQKPASGQTYSGISRSLEDIDFSDTEYITLSFMPTAPTPQTLTVMLRLDTSADDTEYAYEGIVQLASNEESELTFKVSDLVRATDGKIDTLKLWYKPSSGTLEAGDYGLWLDRVTIHEKTGLSAFVTVLIWILSILLLLAVIAAIVFVYRSKETRNRIKGFVGKTRSKFIGFLKDKKIISRRHKKKKGAKLTPPKQPSQPPRPVQTRDTGVRIVNGRVLPRPARPAQQNIQKSTEKNDANESNGSTSAQKDEP